MALDDIRMTHRAELHHVPYKIQLTCLLWVAYSSRVLKVMKKRHRYRWFHLTVRHVASFFHSLNLTEEAAHA